MSLHVPRNSMACSKEVGLSGSDISPALIAALRSSTRLASSYKENDSTVSSATSPKTS